MADGTPRFDVIGQLAALRRYARSLTRDPGDAEDLVHDALVNAYERRRGWRADGNLKGWLLAIVHNTFVDRLRARRAERARIDAAAEIAPNHAPAEQEHAVRLAQVRESFMLLSEEQRAALHLVAIEGLSYQEAAAVLGVPVGTLMSRLGRARAALRALEEGGGGAAAEPPRLRIVGGQDDAGS